MENDSVGNGKGWLTGPAVFAAGVLALLLTWAALDPATLIKNFDADGFSPFEIATLPFYAAIIPFVWWKCPFDGSRARRTLLCAGIYYTPTAAHLSSRKTYQRSSLLFPNIRAKLPLDFYKKLYYNYYIR